MKQIANMHELHQLLRSGLLYIKEICEKNGLRFFLSNGTLLGAVKYSDFIPWDDDADVLIPREDYMRLLSLPNIDNENYRFLSKERVQNWKAPYAKLSLEKTIMKETTADFGMSLGLSIDIFPIDKWNDIKSCALLQASLCSLMKRFLSASIEDEFYTPKRGIARLVLYCIWLYSRKSGSSFHYKQIERQILCGKKNRGLYVGCVAWAAYGNREVFPDWVFSESVDVQLAGDTYPAPVGFDYYLKSLYGEYSLDPPIENQKSNHVIKVWYKDNP